MIIGSLAISANKRNISKDKRTVPLSSSKGGAEATANAIATNKNAIVFNPATPFPEKYGLSLDSYTANIDVFVVKGEKLDNFSDLAFGQNKIGIKYGNRIELPQIYPTDTDNKEVNKQNEKDNHAIATVIKALMEGGFD